MTIDQKILDIAKGVAAYAHPDTRDLVEKATVTALQSVAKVAKEEGCNKELDIFEAHLNKQIYQMTVNTDSIYNYIDARREALLIPNKEIK